MRNIIIEQTGLSEFHKIEKRFNNFRKNIKKFNGGLLKYETVKVGNGKIFRMYYQGVIKQEISLLADRYCWELSRTSF